MHSLIFHKLVEACREQGCPVCHLEGQSLERYLDSQFYENVNSPRWRDHLRASHGLCREHAWLAVEKRLGDPLGFSIIYRDILNSIAGQLEGESRPARGSRRRASLLGQVPEQARAMIANMLSAIIAHRHCPACEHRDKTTRDLLSTLVEELKTPEMIDALRSSAGLCLPHLRLALEHVRDVSVSEALLTIHRQKLESLRTELDEFIRKSDYQFAGEGFGKEGNAWLRAIGMVVGKSDP